MGLRENPDLKFISGVHVSESALVKFSDFEKNYLAVREKEKRVISLEEVRRLPYPQKDSVDYALWETRRKNILRFNSFLSKKGSVRILDIGCGNGFFTNMLSERDNEVVGLDVNLTELKQAAEAFPSKNIKWYYLDILTEKIPEEKFDLITFCASFHYFKDPKQLLRICQGLLKTDGEVHIIDSPFYSEEGRENARKRSVDYFRSMKVESMSDYYFHNSYSFLKEFNVSIKYKPGSFFKKLLRIKDSPFPWIMIS